MSLDLETEPTESPASPVEQSRSGRPDEEVAAVGPHVTREEDTTTSFSEDCVHVGLQLIFIGALAQLVRLKESLFEARTFVLDGSGLLLAVVGITLVLPFPYGRSVVCSAIVFSCRCIAKQIRKS